jgi:hypothetical protein
VPDFIKCLEYIQKGCIAILFGFDCFVNLVHYSVCLLNVIGESQIDSHVGLVGFQLWGEVCGEVCQRLWRERGGGLPGIKRRMMI